jgi:Asp-tRNA(Asn)/Glu-tRNA(Gln) amidotransferase A subunit family amidase
MLQALDLAGQIEAGEFTPADVVERCAQAIAEREAEVRAFAALDLEAVHRQAVASAALLAAAPLRGLCVGIKDNFDTIDWPTGYGSPIYAGHRPSSDAALVNEIRRAGGLILGKTVTTELAFMCPGPTRNPHHLGHTPGGSSSGSAAAVAAGMIPIGVGSQTAGSVIRPAAYCGVAGFKPTFGLLPTVGMKCFSWHLDTAGVFAARVVDVAFAAAAMTGRALRIDREPARTPRIALVRTHKWNEASEAMQGALETAARAAAAAGAIVDDVMLPPLFEHAFDAQAVIQNYEAYRALGFEYDRFPERLSPQLREALEEAARLTPAAYDAARRSANRARRAWAELISDGDVLMTPSAPGSAPCGLSSTGVPIFNRLWTLLGTPCVNVPGLVDAAQLPLGVQIVGAFGRDRSTLEAALFLETALQRQAADHLSRVKHTH